MSGDGRLTTLVVTPPEAMGGQLTTRYYLFPDVRETANGTMRDTTPVLRYFSGNGIDLLRHLHAQEWDYPVQVVYFEVGVDTRWSHASVVPGLSG